jgi:uncharacterized protein YcfJ
MASADQLSVKSKSVDFVVRSVTTAVIALVLVAAIVYCAVMGKTLDGATGAALLTAVGTVIGYFFGNHAAVNGGMVASVSQRRATDALQKDAA